MSRIYSVETRPQAALIIGQGSGLALALATALKQQGIFTVDENYSLHSLLQTHDLDYLIVFASSDGVLELFNKIYPSLADQSPQIILLHHQATSTPPIPNLSLEIVYPDFIGASQYVSPILSRWANTLTTTRSIIIPGDGLANISLLSDTDLVAGAVSAITSPNHKKALFLTTSSSISLLNLAYELRSLLPGKINLTFDPQDSYSLSDPQLSAFPCPETIKLPKLLNLFVQSLLLPKATTPDPQPLSVTPPPTPKLSPAPSPASKPTRLSRFRSPEPVFAPLTPPRPSFKLSSLFPRVHFSTRHSILARGLIIAFALYLSALAFATTVTILSLRSYLSATQTALPSPNPLGQTTATFLQANLYAVTLFPGAKNNQSLTDLSTLLDAYQQFLALLPTVTDLSNNTSNLTRLILNNNSPNTVGGGDIPRLISDSRLQAETLYQQLSLLDGSLPAVAPATIPTRFHDNYSGAKTILTELKRSVLMSKGVLSILPDLIGIGGRRKYGVLFQNNMELRATGGFIGSFAILSFDNGTLYDMPIYDVYAADGNLKGHVEPPTPIKDILGEANWYLRDSNFDPDFPTSARRAEWFIQKTMNLELDGIVALNLDALRALLSVTGPLNLPDYNETITSDNLYERAQYHAEVNFFPGSTQKKEFLSSVGNALFTQLSTADSSLGLPTLNTLLNSLDNKSILMSVKRESTEHVLSTLAWNGALLTPPDSLMVVDSNFGVNKANYYVSRAIELLITLDKSLNITHTLRIRYNNTATSNSWPAGPYKNYSRLVLPPNTTITSIKVADQILDKSDYTISTEHNRTVVGFFFTVPINSTLGVEVNYLSPTTLANATPNYSWYWQKQPGTSSQDPVKVYLNYPLYLKPQVISPEAATNPQQLVFDFANDTDHRLSVQFSQ